MKKTELRYLVIAVAVLLAAGVGCYFMEKRVSEYKAALEQDALTLTDYETKLALKRAGADAGRNRVVAEVIGIDADRKAKDDDVAYGFLGRVLNWSNVDEYNEMRLAIIDEYGLASDNSFVTQFLAPAPYVDKDTERYTCHLSGFDTIVMSISGDKYSYFSQVEAVASSPKGASGTSKFIFMYTIDGAGNISDLAAYGA